MSPYTTSAEDKILSDRLARLPVRVIRSDPHIQVARSDLHHQVARSDFHHQVARSNPRQHHRLVTRTKPHQLLDRAPATNLRNAYDHLRYFLPNLQSRKRVTKMQIVDTAKDHIQELVLDLHINLWRSRSRGWAVDWSTLKMAGRAPVKKSVSCVDMNLVNSSRSCHTSSVVEHTPAPPCLFSSPPSVDSGYDTSEFSPSSSSLSSPGEGLGYVEEIDQFLDSFEFGPHKELLNTSDEGETELFDEGSLAKYQAVENSFVNDHHGKANEIEETIENIEESVKMFDKGSSFKFQAMKNSFVDAKQSKANKVEESIENIKECVKIFDEGTFVMDQAMENSVVDDHDQQAGANEVEESIENIEECVRNLTSEDQGIESKKSTSISKGITMYDINGLSFTVLQLDPIYSD